MEHQGTPVSTPPAATAPPPGGPPPASGYGTYGPPPSGGGSGGKIALVVGAVVLLAILGACAIGLVVAVSMGDVAHTRGDSIALIHLTGAISGGGSANPETLISQIESAEDDSNVKAILLRIDSPGGTVAASQEIATAVARAEKPVVASIGDAGASGAYMIASQCDEIVASPTSSVGSIGVVMEVPNLEGLLGKAGVEVVVITKGELKDIGSPFRDMTPEERKLIDGQMTIAYNEFISLVAKGRDLPEAKVREYATGWIWMGVEAKKMGLVDTLGNYSDGVDAAAERGGIEGDPNVVDFGEPELPTLLRALLTLSERLPALTAYDPTALAPAAPAVPR